MSIHSADAIMSHSTTYFPMLINWLNETDSKTFNNNNNNNTRLTTEKSD